MEVTIDEVQQLWSILQQDSELLVSFERCGLEKVEEAEEEGRRLVRKRKETSPTTIASMTGLSDGGPSKIPPSKRRKRMTRSTTPKSNPSPALSNISTYSKSIISCGGSYLELVRPKISVVCNCCKRVHGSSAFMLAFSPRTCRCFKCQRTAYNCHNHTYF